MDDEQPRRSTSQDRRNRSLGVGIAIGIAIGVALGVLMNNIGMGIGTSINELVTLLLELTGSSIEPEYRAEAQSFVTHRIGSIDKAAALLGFRAGIPLREGLQSVVQWRMAQRASIS